MPKVIVIEGIDGTGKTTVAKELVKQIASLGKKVTYLNTPSSELPVGKMLREQLLTGQLQTSMTVQGVLMMAACREIYEHIEKNLQDQDYIILDRFIWSTLVYNQYTTEGGGGADDHKFIAYMSAGLFDDDDTHILGPMAWSLFYLTGSVETITARLANRTDEHNEIDDKVIADIEKYTDGYATVFQDFCPDATYVGTDDVTPTDVVVAILQELMIEHDI